jgi:glutamine synthetase
MLPLICVDLEFPYNLEVTIATKMFGSQEHCVATYVWIGEDSANDIRSLRRVLPNRPTKLAEIPLAVCDGTYLGTSLAVPSALVLHPVSVFPNPQSPERDVVVLCQPVWMQAPADCQTGQVCCIPANTRPFCDRIMREASDYRPTFVVMQEYSIRDGKTNEPLGMLIELSSS